MGKKSALLLSSWVEERWNSYKPTLRVDATSKTDFGDLPSYYRRYKYD